MSSADRQIENSLEQLQMDERLRSNLIDDEAQLVLTWATARLMNCANLIADESIAIETVKAEMRRTRSMLRNINTLFDNDQNPAPIEALTTLGLAPQPDPFPPLPDRAALIQWLLAQVSAAWNANAS